MHKTKLPVDPELELQANAEINAMGEKFILEGAITLDGKKFFRLWYRIFNQGNNSELFYKDVPIDTTKRYTVPVSDTVNETVHKTVIPARVPPRRIRIELPPPTVPKTPPKNSEFLEFIPKTYGY